MSEPLSISFDLADVKTAIPIILDGHICRVRFVNVVQSLKDNDPAKPSLKWEFHLLDPAPTNEGGMVAPGFKLFENIACYAKEGAQKPKWFLEKICKFIDGFLGTADADNKKNKPPRPKFDANTVQMMIGKESFVKVKVKTGEYTGNEIASLTFPGDVTA